MMYHRPVLLEESIKGLNIRPNGVYVDATFGGGGHSKEILERLQEKGRLVGFDQDADAQKNAFNDERFFFIRHNFRYMINFLSYYKMEQVDGILADLGVSSRHFDQPQRGFSFTYPEAELDMRMNTDRETKARDVLNAYTVDQLKSIFRHYGDIKQAGKLARTIGEVRKQQELSVVKDLVECIREFIPRKREHKFLAKVFQALRIEVNAEIDNLRRFLEQSNEVLKSGGRLVVIAYHSAEDRIVKNFMRTGHFDGTLEKDFYGNPETPFTLVNKQVIVPGEEEITRNPRSRSAKMRIAEKK